MRVVFGRLYRTGAGWLDGTAWFRVRDRFKPAQATDTFTREIRAMCSAAATGRRLPRNGEPLGIGGIVNHQRQEWTDVRRDWNRDATAMLAAAQFGVVLRGGAFLEKSES